MFVDMDEEAPEQQMPISRPKNSENLSPISMHNKAYIERIKVLELLSYAEDRLA